jgi:sugar lactone lactonase YvrE
MLRKVIVRSAPTTIRTAPAATKAVPRASSARPRFFPPPTVVNSVNFGNAVVTAAPVSMTLTYATPATTLTAAATANMDFAVTSSNCGTSGCSVVVTFTPGYPGLRYDAISLTDGSGNLVYETYVYGLGQAPQFGYELGNETIFSGFTNSPLGVAIGPDEYVYYTSTGGDTIYKAARDFSSATTITLTGLGSPSGIVVDGSNKLYVADQANNQIISYTAAGVQGTVTTTPLSGPSQLAIDGTGALYIADTGNGRIIKIDNQQNETTLDSGLTSPTGVAVDSAGDVFYSDNANNGEIFEIAAGSTTPTTQHSGINQVPDNLAVDASGAVYLTTDQGINIFRPNVQTEYGANGVNEAFGLAIDRQGDIFLTQPLNNTFTIDDRTASNFILNTPPRTPTNGGLTISNTGNQALFFSGFSTTGPLFTVDSSSQCTAGGVIQPATTCDVTIDFTPPAAMYYTDTMIAVSNSLNAPGTTDPFYLAGSGIGAPSTTSLTASPNPVQSGNPVQLLITVADTMGFTPSGQVSILDGSTVLGPATLSAGTTTGTSTAQFTIPSLSVGTHNLTVTFPGDANVSPSTSNQVNVTATNGPPPPNGGIPVTSQTFPATPVGQTASMNIVYSPVSGTPVIATTVSQDFAITATACTASCTATVTFTPQFPGLRSDIVTVTDGSGNLLAQTFVNGIGTGPQFAFAESDGFQSTGFQTPMGIALAPNGTTFFFTDPGTNQVWEVASASAGTGNPLPILNLGTPAGVAVDANQTVYVADQTHNLIFTYNLTTQVTGSVATSQLSKPTGLAVDGSGDLYIADTGNNRILEIDNQGNQTIVASGLNGPQAVAVDGAGNVFYVDAGNGGEIIELPIGGGTPISILSSQGNLHYLAVDAGDTVYFTTDSGLSSVGPTGNINAYHNFLTVTPYGIALAPNGDLYVTGPASGQWSVATRSALNTTVQSNVGVPLQIQFRINNTGNAPLTISGYAFSSPVVALDPATPCTTVAAGDNCYTTVDFTPTAVQSYQAAVTLTSNSLNQAGSANVLTVYGQGNPSLTTSSTTTLAASSNAIALGQSVVLTATVSDTTAVTPTGTVNFLDGTTVIGSAALGSSTAAGTAKAQFTAASLAVGSHSIAAAYFGDANVPASTSSAQTVIVSKAPTTTTLILSAPSIPVGHIETLTANVQGNGTTTPTGTVTFFDGATSLGSAPVSGGPTGVSASLPVSTLSVGTHSITATYSGDPNYALSTSTAQTVTVTTITTTTTLGTSAATLSVGQPETLTATIVGAATPAMTGTVTFFDGTTSLGSVPVISTATGGTASLTLSTLAAGAHSITAHYSGDPNYALSTSTAQTVTVTTITTTTTLGISAATLSVGQPEILTATIAGIATPAMTGAVTFFDGTTSVGTSSVTSTATGGIASLTLSTLATGTHSFTAHYSGDTNYLLSTSSAQTVTVSLVTQTITFPAIPNHTYGDAPFTLSATASSGLAVSYIVTSGPATVSGNTVTLTGVGTVAIQATQAGNATYAVATPATRTFTVAAPPPTLANISPATALVGASATTVTLTGTNFTASDTVQLNGAAVVPIFVNATTLTAVVPASLLATAGTVQIAVFDPVSNTTTPTQPFTVAPAPAIVFSGPSTTASGQQPALTFQLVNPYPLALSGTLTLAFTPTGTAPVDDPAVQFSAGGRTLAFSIPALSTTTPAVQIQSGTIAGTVTITLVVTTVAGVNLTPTNVVPVIITIPPAVPAISTAAISRSGNTLTVTIDGFSNTRELSTATFHFTAASGSSISNPDITAPVTPEFATWFTSAASDAYGSTFSYTQTFNLNNDANTVESVTVTLVNSIGNSLQGTAQ